MKKGAILLLAAVLLCTALTACGTKQSGTSSTSAGGISGTQTTDSNTDTTDSGMMNGTPQDEIQTVSEWVSEGMSELGDSSFLDPQNGIISDTQTAQ